MIVDKPFEVTMKYFVAMFDFRVRILKVWIVTWIGLSPFNKIVVTSFCEQPRPLVHQVKFDL